MRSSFALFALLLPVSAFAQSPAIENPTITLEQVTTPQAFSFTLPPIKMPVIPKDIDISDAVKRKVRPIIPITQERQVRLPLALNFALSRNRDVILQFGDPLFRMHPHRVDLYWIDEKGEISTEITNQFDGAAQVNMSRDGFTAVAGAEFLSEIPQGKPRPKRVHLYSPKGEILAQSDVSEEQIILHLEALDKGKGVLFALAPEDDPLSKHQLYLLDRTGEKPIELDVGILQKIVPLDPETCFVQGSEGYALIDLNRLKPLWVQSRKIRLVGPEAVALTPNGRMAVLVTGDRTGSDALYRWTVSVLDRQSGKGLAGLRIDGEHPGVSEEVFARITDKTATIRVDGALRTIAFNK